MLYIVDGKEVEVPEGETPPEGAVLKPEEKKDPPAEETELHVAIGADPVEPGEVDDIEAPMEDGTAPTPLVKQLRTAAKESAQKARELEKERDEARREAEALRAPKEPDAVVVGEKPTLESSEYDQEKFASELEAYYERKRKAEEQERKREEGKKAAETAYAARLGVYADGAKALKVADFAASEQAVKVGLTPMQQSIIVKHANNAALLVYALGKDGAKLKELGAIADPIEFAARVARIETEIKTVSKPKFQPEKRPSGGGTGSPATGASALEKAREKAAVTGDYTEVNRMKREQRNAVKK
jgi:hypothetical protein